MSEKIEHTSLAEEEDAQEITDKLPANKRKWQRNQGKAPPIAASPPQHEPQADPEPASGEQPATPEPAQPETAPAEPVDTSPTATNAESATEEQTTSAVMPAEENEAGKAEGTILSEEAFWVESSTKGIRTWEEETAGEAPAPVEEEDPWEADDFEDSALGERRLPSASRGSRSLTSFLRIIVSCLLLFISISNGVVLLRGLTPTHLSSYAFNPGNGALLAQNDLGDIPDTSQITAPVQTRSALALTLQSNDAGGQQVMLLTGQGTSWTLQQQFPLPFQDATISATPDNHLLVSGKQGIQMLAADGKPLWHLPNGQPTQGANRFEPISDGTTVYALNSLARSEFAAFNAHTGAQIWKQALDDTFTYSPAPLLDGGSLYVAGNHTLYALDRRTGDLIWDAPQAARSLAVAGNAQSSLLVAAGAQGVTALHPDSGTPAWSFSGQRDNTTWTPTQFYQVAIGRGGTQGEIVYATGISWQIPEVREQVWLYALDGARGTLLWSRQIATGMVSADAARTFPLLVDPQHGVVITQQVSGATDRRISAFDAGSGTPRWTVRLDADSMPAPALLQTSTGAIVLFSVAHSMPPFSHLLLLSIIVLSLLGILLLWLLPLRQGIARLRAVLRALAQAPRHVLYPFKQIVRLWHFSRALVIFGLLFILISASLLISIQLYLPQGEQYQVHANTGAIQWKEALNAPEQMAKFDAQGSIHNVALAENLHQLQARTNDGKLAWQTFASEGTFSLPAVPTRAGTVLVALSGQSTLKYRFAPDDPAFAHPLDSLFVLSLLDRASGKVLWKNVLVPPGGQQSMVVLGADERNIYLASSQTDDSSGATEVRLLAISQQDGKLAWQVFGASEPAISPHDDGDFFLWTQRVIWQVAGLIYAIDPVSGQIAWQQSIANDDSLPPSQMVDQIAATPDALLIVRASGVHALNPTSGDELWVLPSPGLGIGQTPTGVLVINHTIIIYGNGQIQAFDATSQRPLWSQKQLYAIQSLKVSDDGRTLYAALLSPDEGPTPVPVVVALDAQNGAVRWTFQPQNLLSIEHAQDDGFQYAHNQLFVTGCVSGSRSFCTEERLFALDARTGALEWQSTGMHILDVQISSDGAMVQFQVVSSPWRDLLARLGG